MKSLIHKQFNQYITKELDYFFKINQPGVYLVEITARCKNWSQNWKRLFDDDDLRIEINNNPFPKLKKRGLFNAPATFNGNRLKNLSQTNFCLIKLDRLENIISFIPDQKPYLEDLKIYLIADQQFSLEFNKQAEDGDKRPWIALAIKDIPLRTIKISASANKHKHSTDSDDLQIRIDNKKQINPQSKLHRYWYWCGNILKGETKIFEKELNFKQGLHYIELWADREPILHRIEFGIEKEVGKRLQVYTYKGTKGDEDYNKFDRDIIKAVEFWNNEFSKQKYPPKELLDPNLVKAIVYVESRMGYYKPPKGYYPAYPDTMQVADPRNPAIHTLNNDGWIDPKTGQIAREYEIIDGKEQILDYKGKANGNTPEESIKWGARWLYHKVQGITEDGKRYWRSWDEAVMNYRSEGDKEYQKHVYNVYKKGETRKGIKLWSIILIPILLSIISLSLWVGLNQGKVFVSFRDIKGTDDYKTVIRILDGLRLKKIDLAITYANAGNFFAIDKDKPLKIEFFDINNDSQREIIIYGEYLSSNRNVYILTNYRDGLKIIRNLDEWGAYQDAFSADLVFFTDTDNDSIYEIVEEDIINYSNAPDEIWSIYYKLNKNGIYEFFKKEKKKINFYE